ncbi:MAG TPA: response regulator [Zeimonas sp.]|nr:response regulator [Zeimonas sp.]
MTVRRAFRELKVTNPLVQRANGEAAVEFLDTATAHELPCLILLDLNMPVMNGIEFLQVVKRHATWRRIPVVVLTTSEEEQDKIASFDLSVAGYMTKPVDYRKFVEAMRTIDAYWTLSEVAPMS